MNSSPYQRCPTQGFSLAETVIAIGVLATALPLVFGALAEAGKSGMAAQADTRSSWIIPACLAEIDACRAGHPQFLTATAEGQSFPPEGELWALGFAPDGRAVGKVPAARYPTGTGQVDGKPIAYLVTLRGVAMTSAPAGMPPMVQVHLQLEHPATAPVAMRRKLTFHTCLP